MHSPANAACDTCGPSNSISQPPQQLPMSLPRLGPSSAAKRFAKEMQARSMKKDQTLGPGLDNCLDSPLPPFSAQPDSAHSAQGEAQHTASVYATQRAATDAHPMPSIDPGAGIGPTPAADWQQAISTTSNKSAPTHTDDDEKCDTATHKQQQQQQRSPSRVITRPVGSQSKSRFGLSTALESDSGAVQISFSPPSVSRTVWASDSPQIASKSISQSRLKSKSHSVTAASSPRHAFVAPLRPQHARSQSNARATESPEHTRKDLNSLTSSTLGPLQFSTTTDANASHTTRSSADAAEATQLTTTQSATANSVTNSLARLVRLDSLAELNRRSQSHSEAASPKGKLVATNKSIAANTNSSLSRSNSSLTVRPQSRPQTQSQQDSRDATEDQVDKPQAIDGVERAMQRASKMMQAKTALQDQLSVTSPKNALANRLSSLEKLSAQTKAASASANSSARPSLHNSSSNAQLQLPSLSGEADRQDSLPRPDRAMELQSAKLQASKSRLSAMQQQIRPVP